MTCAALCLALGLTVTSSSGLGYESPYSGASAEIEVRHGQFVGLADLGYFSAHKIQTGDGSGQSASVLAGVKFGRWDFLAGAWGSITQTSAYEKSAVAPMVEVGFNARPVRVAAFYSDSADPRVGRSYGASMRGNQRMRVSLSYKHVKFESFFGVPHSGDQVRLGVGWVFGGAE